MADQVRVQLTEADDDCERDGVDHPTHGPLHSTLNHPRVAWPRLSGVRRLLLN